MKHGQKIKKKCTFALMEAGFASSAPLSAVISFMAHDTSFAFTGKEKDSETGLSHFGARYSTSFRDVSWQRPQASLGALLLKRYYDADLTTGWLSVDPMADKYPSISPYAYCAGNPVKLVDPHGSEIYIGQYTECKARKYIPNSQSNKYFRVAGMLDKIYNGSKAGKFVINTLIRSDHRYYISTTKDPNGNGNPAYSTGEGKHRQIYLNVNRNGKNEYTLSHVLFHAFQHEHNQWGRTRSCEVEAFVFAGIVMAQRNGGVLQEDEMSSGMLEAYTTKKKTSSRCINYSKAMYALTKAFGSNQMATAVSHFRLFSFEGEKYGNQNGYGFSLEGNVYHPANSLLNKYKTEIF